jgi:hypothetical protein
MSLPTHASQGVAAPPPSFARRHAWIGVLVVGVALFILVERTMVATGNPNFAPSSILLARRSCRRRS